MHLEILLDSSVPSPWRFSILSAWDGDDDNLMEKVAIVDGIKDKDDVDENCLILCKFSFSSISAQRFRRHPLGKSK